MGKIQILFLAANPKNTSKLKLEEEVRAIDHALRDAEYRNRFNFETQLAVRLDNLQGYLLRYKPNIVHFSGHGSIAGEIIIEDNTGQGHPISSDALSQLFGVFRDTVRCVVLNACYTDEQAEAIAKQIDCVIGMTKAIGDDAAVGFASSFYQAIGFGRNIKDAFILGCNQINIANLNDQDVPQLLVKPGCYVNEMVFARRTNRKIMNKTKKPLVDLKLPPTRLTAKMLIPHGTPKYVARSTNESLVVNNTVKQTLEVEQVDKTPVLDTDKDEYYRGRTLSTLGNFEAAIKHFDNALRVNPQFYEAWCGKGANLYALNSSTENSKLLYEAIRCFDNASKINPQFTEAWYKKGLCLAKLGAVTCNLKRLKEAIECFDKALTINQQFAAGWCGKGMALDSWGGISRDAKRLSEAIECFDKALRINPRFIQAFNRKALSEKILKKWNINSSSSKKDN